MLSKKMTVSLTSLIIIFALAFVASPALALKVTPKLNDDKHDDVSVAEGHQVLLSTLMVKFAFDQPVQDLAAADLTAAFTAVGDADLMVSATSINTANTEVTVTLADDTTITATTGPIVDKSATIYVLADKFTSLKDGSKNPIASITLNYVNFEPGTETDGTTPNSASTTGAEEGAADPKVVSITRAVPVSLPRASSFVEKTVSGPFQVKIVLTEMPNGGLASEKAADRIAALNVSGGKATNVAIGVEFARVETTGSENPPLSEGGYAAIADVPTTTGRDAKYYPYLATIAPDGSKDKVIISVKDFKDMVRARGEGTSAIKAGMYEYPGDKAATDGRDKLEVTVEKDPAKAQVAGLKVGIPDGIIVPAGGYLILGRDDGAGDDNHEKRTDSTQIIYPGDPTVTPILVGDRQPNQLKYNLIKAALPNLETFLGNGGVIDVVSSDLIITEIMWGSDASLATPSHNQWIELYNPGAADYKASKAALMFYTRGEAPAKTAAVAATATTAAMPESLPTGVSDRVGTITDDGVWWSTAGKGQSGRTGQGEAATDLVAVIPTLEVASMYRVMVASTAPGALAGAMMPEMGNMSKGWMQSMPPAVNFKLDATGVRIGSPGAKTQASFATPPPPDTPTPMVDAAMSSEIMISEIMVDTADGRLPQWIELTYSGMDKASLEGWNMVIDNAIDAGVLGGGNAITISLGGVMVDVSKNPGNMGKGQSVLVVAWPALRKSDNIRDARMINVGAQLGQTGRYQLLSAKAFRITLVPPKQTAIAAFGDRVGNLHEDWELPMSEGTARSSIIRYAMLADGTATMGTDANGWVLADSTDLAIGPQSYYGDDEDSSTPGQHAGGPLPVELSHFRPARDKQTGAVVITWATQSELNNAGFFIKRSQQRNGEFKVINATMVPGAGTTSEKQFYTYTDTTAQPNVVYYYQIEDVSLDGNRQTLTRGIRLKGHIGAAGKLTSTWGELKSSNE